MTDSSPRVTLHDALFHRSGDELVAATTAFLREGLERGEHAVLACSEPVSTRVAAALDGSRVSFLDHEGFCRCLPETMESLRRLVADRLARGATRLRLVGEITLGPDPSAWRDLAKLEALRSAALAPLPLWSVCAFDLTGLPDEISTAGQLTHAYLRTGLSRIPNPSFLEPDRLLHRLDETADPVEATEPVLRLPEVNDLLSVREGVRAMVSAVQAEPALVENFVLSANEVVGNAIRHGRPPVAVRLWVTPHRLVLSVTDSGEGFDGLSHPIRPPTAEDLPEGQFGLWLVRHLTDAVTTTRGPHGFTVRISTSYGGPGPV